MTEPTRPDVAAGRRSSRASAKRVTKPGDGVEQLAGVGPQTAARLRSAGIETVRALACVTPTRYRCRRRVASLAEARDGDELELAAEVLRFRERRFRGRYRAQAELVVDGARCTAQWFHPVGGLRERARVGARVLVAGRVRCGAGLPVFSHPRVRGLTDEAPTTAEIERTYPDLEGLGEARLGALCRGAWAALAACSDDDAVELLPPALLRARALPGLLDALRSLHEPPAELSDDALAQLNAGTTAAHRRLLFESHFFLQLELLRRRLLELGAPVEAVEVGWTTAADDFWRLGFWAAPDGER